MTVQHNTLGSGIMGLSIGSSTAGGIEDVLYFKLQQYDDALSTELGMFGIWYSPIKLRGRFGGCVRNIRWMDLTVHLKEAAYHDVRCTVPT